MAYTAAQVMDLAASLLNDPSKALFTYDVQMPFLKMANDDLELELLGVDAPIQNEVCDIDVLIGATHVALPCNFFLPLALKERVKTSTNVDDFADMEERSFEPTAQAGQNLGIWAFRDNKIKLIGATTDRTVRLEFKRTLSGITDSSVVEEVNKAKNFLAFRTAGFVATHVGGNRERGDELKTEAFVYLDKLTGVIAKNNQGIRVRRKPFRLARVGR